MKPTRTIITGVAFVLAAIPFLAPSTGCQAPGPTGTARSGARSAPLPMPTPVRAIWVTRFQYRTPDDVRTIIANCARSGCNTVLWQVRGAGTVAYPSRLEPWSREFGFRDPGFDPLGLAVAEAHRHGLRIEAWVNTTPGWNGRTPPPVSNQLYNAHPDWFMHDAAGHQQPLGDFYVLLNPCWPEVRRHVAAVMDEIVANYDVDGIHLDYVRYAWDGVPNAKQLYPRDPRTLALYRRETGHRPDDDVRAWDHWRANQLTRLVVEVRDAIKRRHPGVTLTASVWNDPRVGYRDYLQNSVAWLRAGVVDALMPMAYTDNTTTFAGFIDAYRNLAPRRRIIPGVGVFQHEQSAETRAQLQHCRAWGGDFALFSYDSLFPGTARESAESLTAQRRYVLSEFVQRK